MFGCAVVGMWSHSNRCFALPLALDPACSAHSASLGLALLTSGLDLSALAQIQTCNVTAIPPSCQQTLMQQLQAAVQGGGGPTASPTPSGSPPATSSPTPVSGGTPSPAGNTPTPAGTTTPPAKPPPPSGSNSPTPLSSSASSLMVNFSCGGTSGLVLVVAVLGAVLLQLMAAA
jgi:hypothetical protein